MVPKSDKFFLPGLLVSLFVLVAGQGFAQVESVNVSSELLTEIREQHGRRAANRIDDWQDLITDGLSNNVMRTLRRVNRFFNRVEFKEDVLIWYKEDYWATPVETLIKNQADCDDYAIGKYLTLRALGIPDESLRLVYATRIDEQISHMVVTYFDDSLEQPVVLDNLTTDIQPVQERSDLATVYSFNSENLWLSQSFEQGERLGSPESLDNWTSMLSRLP